MASAIFRPMEYTVASGYSSSSAFTLPMALALKPPQSDELDARARIITFPDTETADSVSEPSFLGRSDTETTVLVPEAACTVARMRCSCSSYGRILAMAVCALRSLAEDTSFMADVIFSVLCTEPIRPFISFNVGIA